MMGLNIGLGALRAAVSKCYTEQSRAGQDCELAMQCRVGTGRYTGSPR